MHFQIPPNEYAKLMVSIYGNMKDVILDIWDGSPLYRQVDVFDLDAHDGWLLHLPQGIDHDFLAHTEVMVGYRVTSCHALAFDTSIRWNSVPMDWGVDDPIVSTCDHYFPAWNKSISLSVYLRKEILG